MTLSLDEYVAQAWALLQELIALPAPSGEEAARADLLCATMSAYGLQPQRVGNNVYALAAPYEPSLPTVLLNAHIDTVRPVASWQREPFIATIEGDRLYGLGSNDCGGGLVTLLQFFRHLAAAHTRRENVVFVASCEEEISGVNGIERVLPLLPPIDVAIVGEPTAMQPAIAERGLMVVDVIARGTSGHAARGEGVNAIYAILDDIAWLRTYTFPRRSTLLGATTMQVTMITAGTQHNVVPDVCHAVVDVRTNEYYDNKTVFDVIQAHCTSEVAARSFRLNSSHIDPQHPLVARCVALGRTPFGSATLSDSALLPCPSLKLGPGDSARSHTADEYICLSELRQAMEIYLQLFQ